MTLAPIEDQLAYTTHNVNRNSNPSDLKITDLRITEISDVVFRTSIIRIYTNQGIVGHGDIRDGAAKEYALFLKSRLLGEYSCNSLAYMEDLIPWVLYRPVAGNNDLQYNPYPNW